MNYSQSFFKDFYKSTCGGVLTAKYIDFTYPRESTAAQNAGCFFEYLATGYIRKGEEPPQAEYYQTNGKGYSKGDIKPEYVQAAKHAKLFNEVLKQFKNPEFGITLSHGNIRGIADVKADGVLIDLKYSDLLYDRWNEYGWGIEKFEYAANAMQSEDMLTVLQKVPLLWQPLLYSWLYMKMFGSLPKWYFYIASPKSDDVIFRRVDFAPATLAAFDALLPQVIAEIELQLNTGGLIYRPTYSNCCMCKIAESCQQRVTLPQIQVVTI